MAAYLFSGDERKILLVLKALDHCGRGDRVPVAELAREVNLPKTTAWRAWDEFMSRLGRYASMEDAALIEFLEHELGEKRRQARRPAP